MELLVNVKEVDRCTNIQVRIKGNKKVLGLEPIHGYFAFTAGTFFNGQYFFVFLISILFTLSQLHLEVSVSFLRGSQRNHDIAHPSMIPASESQTAAETFSSPEESWSWNRD